MSFIAELFTIEPKFISRAHRALRVQENMPTMNDLKQFSKTLTYLKNGYIDIDIDIDIDKNITKQDILSCTNGKLIRCSRPKFWGGSQC